MCPTAYCCPGNLDKEWWVLSRLSGSPLADLLDLADVVLVPAILFSPIQQSCRNKSCTDDRAQSPYLLSAPKLRDLDRRPVTASNPAFSAPPQLRRPPPALRETLRLLDTSNAMRSEPNPKSLSLGALLRPRRFLSCTVVMSPSVQPASLPDDTTGASPPLPLPLLPPASLSPATFWSVQPLYGPLAVATGASHADEKGERDVLLYAV